MNILTDILSLIRQGKYSKVAEKNDVLVLGKWNEQPDMTGVASPIPYKAVKLIKISDFKVEAARCDYKNTPEVPVGDTATVYQKTEIDPDTGECTVFFRTVKSMSTNLTLALSADNNYLEIDTEGEPNLAANVGSGVGIWKDKVGETLNFKSLIAGSNITLTDTGNEITISSSGGSAGMTSFNVYDENPGGAGPGFTVTDSDDVLMWGRNGVEVITGVPLGSTANPKSIATGLSHYYQAYVSQVSQLGSATPTENVIYNDTGRTLSWSRPAVGRYTATWSTSVDPSKVTINVAQVFKNHPNIANIIGVTGNGFTITTNLVENTAIPDDGILLDTPLEIRIYP